jgi:hypothetical protein
MFDEIGFPREPMIRVVIIRIMGFVAIKIISFDLTVAEVGDLAMSMRHSRFHTHATVWLKNRMQSNGWQWSLISTNNTRFYFVSPWPFE